MKMNMDDVVSLGCVFIIGAIFLLAMMAILTGSLWVVL
jgi:hypothetical protein